MWAVTRKWLMPALCIQTLTVSRYSTALLIGEKAAVLVAEDLGYSGEALDMKVPNYHVPGEFVHTDRL